MSLAFASVNIELSKHLDRVEAFLNSEKPDVLCVQELYEHDGARIASAMGNADWRFAAMSRHPEVAGEPIMGIGIFSRIGISTHSVHYYRGDPDSIPVFKWNDPATFRIKNLPLLVADVTGGGGTYRCATTHFTWTPDGSADDAQREDLAALFGVLDTLGEFVLAGDFNAPRGGEIFTKLAARYTDNIPSEHVWSIDLELHRAGGGKIQSDAKAMGYEGFMVDGLFTTPAYQASNVKMHSGVSDHMAINAQINKLSA